MLLWGVLLVLVAGGESIDGQKSQLTLSPPSPILKGEKAVLTCRGSSKVSSRFQTTMWFKDKNPVFGQRNLLEVKGPGEYQCQTGRFLRSDPIFVEFSQDKVILQAPFSLMEGDTLTLTCRTVRLGTSVKYFQNGKHLETKTWKEPLVIPNVKASHSGNYTCSVLDWKLFSTTKEFFSKDVLVYVEEPFKTPQLEATPSNEPEEGTPVTLTCEARPASPELQLLFSFYKGSRSLKSWTRSPEYQIAEAGMRDSGFYWCLVMMETGNLLKQSSKLQIWVQLPLSGVSLKAQPPEEEAVEGQKLALVCSVAEGTEPITFSWYREGGGKMPREESALELPAVTERDAGRYWCTANNGFGPVASASLNVTVTVPVSPPRLTLGTAGAAVGDEVELCCEAQRGSPPIWYRFYHEERVLGNGSAPAGGAACFSLTVASGQDAGNYSCQAENRVSTGSSEPAILSAMVPAGSRSGLVVGGPLATILVAAVAAALLVYFFKFRKKTGEAPPTSPDRTLQSSADPDPVMREEPQATYVNVKLGEVGSVVYSEFSILQGNDTSPSARSSMVVEEDFGSVLYADVKGKQASKEPPHRGREEDAEQDTAMSDYENVTNGSPAVGLDPRA
uniref:Ig-like domain-containing protein n=1 Tax=Ornithorhynchus anatinus TaxID=9258 RepID=F6PW07_ORNAN